MDQNKLPCSQSQDKDIKHIIQTLSLDYTQIPTKKKVKLPLISKPCTTITSSSKPCQQCQPQPILSIPNRSHPKTYNCKRCKTNKAVLLNKNEQICKQCLLKNIEYKTRLYLQNKIKIKSHHKLLICFSGGLNSICLIYILYRIKVIYKKNPLFGNVQCLHIQQQSKLPNGYIQKFEQITSFKLNILPIQLIYGKQSNKTFENINKLFSSFKANNNNSIDLLVLFRNKLIIQFGQQHKFDYILFGNNGQSFSAEIFKYFTKGVGGSTSQLADNTSGPFQYPLRQHLLKQLHKMSMIASSDDLSNLITSEIDSCLIQFITTLQSKYSHTTPAIVRASQKIKSNLSQAKMCKWCWLKHDRPQQLCQKCTRLRECIKDQQSWKMMPEWTIF